MCEFSQRLVAWLDGELPEGEAAKIARHLAQCTQCRGQLAAYRQASAGFEAYSNKYGDMALHVEPSRTSRRATRAMHAAAGAAAIAAGITLFFLASAPLPSPLRTLAENGSARAGSLAVQTAQKEPATVAPASELPASEAAVEIAIPADDIFPPGAVPAGVSFTADVTMASDGSAEQIRLRPQLTEFETKGAQR